MPNATSNPTPGNDATPLPCPTWCTSPDHDGWEHVEHNAPIRVHSGPTFGPAITVGSVETPAGATAYAQVDPELWFPAANPNSYAEVDADQLRRVADNCTAAATWLDQQTREVDELRPCTTYDWCDRIHDAWPSDPRHDGAAGAPAVRVDMPVMLADPAGDGTLEIHIEVENEEGRTLIDLPLTLDEARRLRTVLIELLGYAEAAR